MKPEIYIIKSDKLEVHISTLGATLTRIITSNSKGEPTDVLLGFDEAEDYVSTEYLANYPYLGSCIGRYANRIANGKFSIDGQIYQLAQNDHGNHLHGGAEGFDKKTWNVTESSKSLLILSYTSPDGEENYPGTLIVNVRFSVTGSKLRIDYSAQTDKKCFVNIMHHPYFNLNPDAENIKEHTLKIYSKKYLKTNNLIPDGTFVDAQGIYDFSTPQKLDNVIETIGGLDDCYVFDNGNKLARLAELKCAQTGINLYVCSTYPGLQVYTGKYLNVKNGKRGKNYDKFAGIALEAQHFPDSPNHKNFPETLLLPEQMYAATTVYGFE